MYCEPVLSMIEITLIAIICIAMVVAVLGLSMWCIFTIMFWGMGRLQVLDPEPPPLPLDDMPKLFSNAYNYGRGVYIGGVGEGSKHE